MTEPLKKSEQLSETCKTHLVDVYVSNKYDRNTDIQNKYIQKGLMVEEDAITLYSRVNKKFFKKNEAHLSNDFIKGTPDLYTGKSIHEAETIIDIKSSWDLYTFFRVLTKNINSLYYWQLQGYMYLTGAQSATLAYCLVNTPGPLVYDEQRKLMYKMGVATDENEDYQKACEEMERLMLYDDIPLAERVINFPIERDEDDIARIGQRVQLCREWLNEFERKRNASVKVAEYDSEVKAVLISQP